MEINNNLNNTLQQLSSGKRINSASDDAAGLQIAERLGSEINSNSGYISNALDTVSFINTADSALQNINTDTQRIRELTVQAGNGIYNASDIKAIQNEINQLQGNINDTLSNTEFNGKSVFNNGIQSTISQDNNIDISPSVQSVLNVNIQDPQALEDIDDFLQEIQFEQTELGAQANAIDSTVNRLLDKNVNESSSRSRIQDLDFAQSTSNRSIQEVQENIKLNIQKIEDKQKGNLLDLLI